MASEHRSGLLTLTSNNFYTWKELTEAGFTDRGLVRAILPHKQVPTPEEQALHLSDLKLWRAELSKASASLTAEARRAASRLAASVAQPLPAGSGVNPADGDQSAGGSGGAAATPPSNPEATSSADGALTRELPGAGEVSAEYLAVLHSKPEMPSPLPPVDTLTRIKALNVLKMYVGPQYLHLLAGIDDPEEAWRRLESHFQRDTHLRAGTRRVRAPGQPLEITGPRFAARNRGC